MSKSEKRNKTKIILVRVTPEEQAEFKRYAEIAGVTVAEYLRRRGLKRKLRSVVELHVINELRRLGGLQKHLFKQGNGVLSKEYAMILVQIKEYIVQLGSMK